MNTSQCAEIFRRLQAINPHPTTELVYNNPFELLIAVILSAQATDKSVNKATKGLFAAANSPETMLALGEYGIKTHIKTIGLTNTKAKNILATCQRLIAVHQSNVPKTRDALEALAGVGRKTANVILNTAFKQPTMAVDTHIFRVSNRTGLAHGNNVLTIEKGLLNIIPDDYLMDAHHWLILHGRYTCIARHPKCAHCVIHDLCEYQEKTA